MHILFLTDNFPPEVNAPASRTFEHCCEWVKAGHKVTVVTCVPNFPKGKVFDGYRNRLWQQEEMAGIRVIRVWSYITANEGFARRVADYISYMVTATLAAPFVRGVDLVIGTSPQFFTACAAYTVSRLKRIPFVFELRDLWPESIRAVGAMKQSAVLIWLERVELFLYRKAALIVSVTNSFRENLAARGVNTSKVRVITNGVDSTRFQPRARDEELVRHHGLEGKFVTGYIGTHGMAHALETILDAAERFRGSPGGDVFRFLLLGDGASKAELMAQARARGLNSVIFVDTVSKDEVVRYWSLLDTSIIHLRKSELFHSVIPSKLFECMGMGIPVLLGVEGEAAGIVEREDIGLVFEPEDAEALCRRLDELFADKDLRQRLSRNGLKAAGRYDRNALATEMLGYLDNLVSRAD
ncbi:glycosyltransferase family 4 protein [Mesorhizobium sp. L48C026A00]|uniref:glycosyltransferase family 4 protein n=1 Tax=Mesorhizobium sp. L48C026A00 TaxID=1287182 RepID=UPI0004135B6E|nr:glycosyltransferase family 4 protein [Mesorhizobium sp. L48C026A00]